VTHQSQSCVVRMVKRVVELFEALDGHVLDVRAPADGAVVVRVRLPTVRRPNRRERERERVCVCVYVCVCVHRDSVT
jgi:hypothetical protein